MTEKLKITDLVTRFTYYPSLTIDDRYRINYKFDLDFNLPGDWYFRVGLFENFDSQPPPACRTTTTAGRMRSASSSKCWLQNLRGVRSLDPIMRADRDERRAGMKTRRHVH